MSINIIISFCQVFDALSKQIVEIIIMNYLGCVNNKIK